jgi:SM-20-related protein
MSATLTTVEFQLNPRLDPAALHALYQPRQRLHVRNLLAGQAADALYRHLDREVAWSLVLNQGDDVREATPEQRREFSSERELELAAFAYEGARKGFQFLYECRRVPEEPATRAAEPSPLHRFVDFLNSPPFLDFARRLTGIADIEWADAQATRYGPGHFLTRHDDSSGARNRRVAYVMNLTPFWNTDWGGQLQFIDADGHVARAFVPAFNALNLFTVPQWHAVSVVAPFAAAPRYSVTGWLRAR